MRFRACLALIMLLVIAAPIFAQGDGPSAEVVVQHSAEIVFPAAIRFELTVDAEPEAIARVEFALAQSDVRFASQAVGVGEDAEGEPVSLAVDWPIPVDSPPELFADMVYTWRVVLQDSTEQQVEGTFLFQPDTGTWRVVGDAPVTFAVSDSGLNLTGTRQNVLPIYELMAENTGLAPVFRWVILSRGHAYCPPPEGDETPRISPASNPDVRYACDENAADQLMAASGYAALRRSGSGLLAFQDDVVDAIFAAFYDDFWAGQRVPGWFVAGLQQLYRANAQPLALQQVQEAARAGAFYTAAQLQRGPSDEDVFDLWTAQTYTLTLFLADRFGAEAPFALAEAVRSQDLADALEDISDLTWPAFLIEWERWLFSDAALQAVRWTVLQPETPTPAPSATAIPPLPTNTPLPAASPVATLTPQATATLLDRDVITAEPTYTATLDVLPTATNTPRPPGSLDAPPGSPSPETAEGGSGPCPAALPALLLPGLAVVAGYQRKR